MHYADNLQIYDHCLASDTSQLTNRLIHCIEIVGRWMSSNRLRLNPSKTEFICMAGFDTSSGKMYLRSNHHRRGNYTTIANGSRSRSVYRFLNWFRRERHQAGDWWGNVTFTSANSGRFVGRSPSSPRTPWWGRWSWHASTTVADFLEEHRSASSARYPASHGQPHDWFCAPSNTHCSRSDPHRTALAWHSIKSNFQFNLIQLRYLHAPTYKLSRWRARVTQKTWSPGGDIKKKVSFQFNFEIVQRETRVAQVHWKCIPGSRRCEIESSRTYRLGFCPGD